MGIERDKQLLANGINNRIIHRKEVTFGQEEVFDRENHEY